MSDDPIVDEVRRIREQLARECDFDIGKLLAKDRDFFRRWKGKKVTKPFHPEWRAPGIPAVAEEKVPYGAGKKKLSI